MKKKEDAATRSKILSATVKLLFTTGAPELTTRNIARTARVNIAAINYHFRSKEFLINEAVAEATKTAFDNGMKILLDPSQNPADRLKRFLTGYTYGLMEYPHLTRTSFLSLFLTDASDNPYGTYTKEMVRNIGSVIGEISGSTGIDENSMKALIVVAGVLFPFLIAQNLKHEGVIDYKDQGAREKYIAALLKLIHGKK